MMYSAMIYGWTFYYEIGERARRIDENIELEPINTIEPGDPMLRVTNTEVRDSRLWVWTDYHLTEMQQRRIQTWRSDKIRNAQAVGQAPAAMDEYPGWLMIKKAALEDSARAALRAMLRSSERNRPKEVTGVISLAAFPRFYIDGGRMSASARFRVQIKEIIPYAAY
jgi:ferric-dicitrate binding protein FerR (iron transport regulator)